MSKFLQERMMYTSDAYSTYVCDICGLFAQRVIKKENRNYPLPSDVIIGTPKLPPNILTTIKYICIPEP